jgi:2-C-methyl-D-erythritol 2,4-cyclodiphosphate synthase
VELVRAEGYELVNADITIALQSPKIAPFIEQMRKTISEVIECDVSAISVKATTTEKLGYVGREEGIVAYATVLLEKM